MSNDIENKGQPEELNEDGKSRRDFLLMTACGVAAVGIGAGLVPFVTSLAPSAEVLAVGSTEVDIGKIKEGEASTVMWRGQPVFVMHRTQNQIKMAQEVNLSDLKDPQLDSERVKKGHEDWLVAIGVCTHLGCVPLANKGDYGGWLCPCHGSHYDSSARIRKGPAPLNLPIPPYEFLTPTKIKIG